MKKLIINADDFGYSDHTVDWTVRCFNAGVLSSATLMVNREAFGRAVEYARMNPQYSFGLHLCLSDECPVSTPSEIPSLVTHDGLLLPTKDFVKRCFLGKIKRADLEREIRAQFRRLRDAGIEPSHLDGHGHMHRIPFVLRSLINLRDELQLTRMRPAQDIFYKQPSLPFTPWLNQWVNRRLKRRFKTPAHFLMTSGKIGEKDRDWIEATIINFFFEDIVEIGVHPGVDEDWRRLDIEVLLQTAPRLFDENNVKLVSYCAI